jgi:hypothetical protein
MSSPFCRKHRSHFCPCVRSDLYRLGIRDTKVLRNVDTLAKSQRAWDEAEQREREKTGVKDG